MIKNLVQTPLFKAQMQSVLNDPENDIWPRIAPLLDDAVAELDETSRHAIVLRFYEGRNLREVGEALGTSEDAAQKRLSRAVERLREYFARRGVSLGASGVVVISANAVQTAPAGLAVTISATALAATSVTTTATAIAPLAMNWINLKSTAAILAAAVGAGTLTYVVQQRETNRSRAESRNMRAQYEVASSERDAALAGARNVQEQLERSRKEQAEILRLRGEVAQLRRQLESQKTAARAQPAARTTTEPVIASPGAYITKDQLAHVGYATPEAALQTITWAMIKATYEQVNEGLSPEMLAGETKDPKGREGFEARQKVMAPLFKGLQVVAKKLVSDEKVELKVKMDADPIPGQERAMPPFMIQPMVKVGDGWKLGGSTREHKETWEQDGQIQNYTP